MIKYLGINGKMLKLKIRRLSIDCQRDIPNPNVIYASNKVEDYPFNNAPFASDNKKHMTVNMPITMGSIEKLPTFEYIITIPIYDYSRLDLVIVNLCNLISMFLMDIYPIQFSPKDNKEFYINLLSVYCGFGKRMLQASIDPWISTVHITGKINYTCLSKKDIKYAIRYIKNYDAK